MKEVFFIFLIAIVSLKVQAKEEDRYFDFTDEVGDGQVKTHIKFIETGHKLIETYDEEKGLTESKFFAPNGNVIESVSYDNLISKTIHADGTTEFLDMKKGEYKETKNSKSTTSYFNPLTAVMKSDRGEACSSVNIENFANIPLPINSIVKQLDKYNYFKFGNVSIQNNCIKKSFFKSKKKERVSVQKIAQKIQRASKKLINCLKDIGTPQRIKDAMALQSIITNSDNANKPQLTVECLKHGEILNKSRFNSLSHQEQLNSNVLRLEGAAGMATPKGSYGWPSLAINKDIMDDTPENVIGHELLHLLGYVHRGYPDETYALEIHCFGDRKNLSKNDKKRIARYVKKLGTEEENSLESITDWFVVYNKHSNQEGTVTRPLGTLFSAASNFDLLIGFYNSIDIALKEADEKQKKVILGNRTLYAGVIHKFTEHLKDPRIKKVLSVKQIRDIQKIHLETGEVVDKEISGGGFKAGNVKAQKELTESLGNIWYQISMGHAFSREEAVKETKRELLKLYANDFGCKQFKAHQQDEIRNLVNSMKNYSTYSQAMLQVDDSGSSRTDYQMSQKDVYWCR